MNTQFEANKVRQQLNRSGKVYDFFRPERNEFGEPIYSPPLEGCPVGRGGRRGEPPRQAAPATPPKRGIKALYHEETGFIRVGMTDTTNVRKAPQSGQKKQPMLLCLWESVVEADLKFGDYTMINGKKYTVSAVTNVQEWNIIADISLEVEDDGNQISL